MTRSWEEFEERAKRGTLVPVVRELSADTLTPVTAFLRLRSEDEPAFLFESVEGGERIGRYSFIGTRPFRTVSVVGDAVTIDTANGERTTRRGNFFSILEDELRPYRSAPAPELPPLTAGAVGWIGYDAVRFIERIPDRHPRDTSLPDAELRFYDSLVAFDHAKHRLFLIANAHVASGDGEADLRAAYDRATTELDRLHSRLVEPAAGESRIRLFDVLPPGPTIATGMTSDFTPADFEAAVARAREHIFAGDIFQVVLSQRFRKDVSVDPFEVYRCLRALNPSPYLFFIQRPDTALLGSSPEIMVRVEKRVAMVRPIAGTRR
ncbi:MAG TPA: chorismate-binding protein, partial [Planctomycetota bacterium]|nr:chorismate-binding protein [Planctomycetota bacterium]